MQLLKHRTLIIIVLMLTGIAPHSHAKFLQAKTAEGTSSADSHLGKGYDALKQDRYDVAVEEFRAALAIDPRLTLRARFPMAVALFEEHKSDEARQEFETVRREVGDHPNILYYLGRLDLDARNFAPAIRNLTEAAAAPPFPDTAYYLGFAYSKQGDFTSAEKWLLEAATSNPHDARIPYQLGFVYRKLGREEEAKKAFALSEELHQRDDKEGRLRIECANKLEQASREEAHAVCDQLYDPQDADKLTELGTIYGQHGDLQAALKSFQRAAELTPQSPQMQYNLALVFYQLNQLESARAPLSKAVKRWPDLFQLNSLYGAVLVKLGQKQEGYDTLRRAYQLNPQDSATADLLYGVSMDLGGESQNGRQYSQALHYLEEAAKLHPFAPEPHTRMAEIYQKTGRSTRARAERQEAERLAKNPQPH